ncbi:putative feruloyl esterase C [Lasiodiplodia theobromae]|uniref:Feruloyl esterase C n=1 Tax=Lasiodiplodia theobromae TaxID=45133 RepID=A0A5N5DRX7_9PEZI|nr:putative feruloyl esterase C [Lasiodiplodia theobromae]
MLAWTLSLMTMAALSAKAETTAGCGSAPSLYTGTHSLTINTTQQERTYILQLPVDYDANTPHALFFGFHWLHGTQEDVYANSWYGLHRHHLRRPASHRQRLAQPERHRRRLCRRPALDALLDPLPLDAPRLRSRLQLRRQHVARAGLRPSAHLPRRRRALGRAFSGCDYVGDAPIGFLGQHGVNDTVIPIASGRGIRDMFVRSNGCGVPPQEPPAPEPLSLSWNKTVYDGCKPGCPVWWIAHGGGHVALPDV